MREYFNTSRRHVSQTNVFSWPDVQLYTRTVGLLKKRSKSHWIEDNGIWQWKRKAKILRFKITEPSSCYYHIASYVNWYNVENKVIVAHNAAESATTNFHYDSSYSIHIINPSREWFLQWAGDYRWPNDCYRQLMMIFYSHLFSHWFCNRVCIWMISLTQDLGEETRKKHEKRYENGKHNFVGKFSMKDFSIFNRWMKKCYFF